MRASTEQQNPQQPIGAQSVEAQSIQMQPKPPPRKQQIITGVLMSAGMAFSLSGFFSWLNVGWTTDLPLIWGANFIKGWPVGFAVSALIAGPVQRLARRLGGPAHPV